MKVTKWQQFYIDTTLEAMDQQFNKSMAELEKIYEKYYQDREKLVNELSRTILEFKVTGEYMELNAKEKKQIQNKLNNTVNGFIESEKNSDKAFIGDTLNDAIKGTYGYKEYILGLGIDFKSLPLDEKEVEKIINNKVAGVNWSSRLWDNKGALENQLRKDIFDFCKGAISINKINKQIQDRFNADKNNTKRLVRTELCRSQQEILNKFDEDHGAEYQLFMATLDGKTSSICRNYDGKVYEINDSNKPNPPTGTHPNCRSVLVGIPDKDYRPDTRRNNEDKTIIPYQDYNEWSGQEPKKGNTTIKETNINKDIMKMNYKELEAKAKELGVIFGDDEGDFLPVELPIDLIRNNIKWYDEFVEEYPTLKKHTLYYGQSSTSGRVAGSCNGRGEMKLNKKYWDDWRVNDCFEEDTLKYALSRGWSTPTTSPINRTFVHELGHYVSTIRARQEKLPWDSYVKKIRNEVNKEFTKITGEKPKGKDFEKLISEYGGSSTHESYAEAFQEAFNFKNDKFDGNSRTYIKIFKEIFIRELKSL